MIAATEHLVDAVRAALKGYPLGMQPIKGMDNHFCSLENEGVDTAGYQLLFPIEVDNKKVGIYLKIS